MALTYTQFIEKVGTDCKFQKCLNNELQHYGFSYKIGMNEDTKPFNASGSCQPGGLYFTTSEHLHDFFHLYNNSLNVAFIKLCEDALFYIEPEGKKFKTNKFYIEEIIQTEEICEVAIQRNPFIIERIINKTPRLCELAVMRYSIIIALLNIEEQTEKICKIAVQRSGYALKFVTKQTLEICEIALQKNIRVYRLVKPEILCKIAIQELLFAFYNFVLLNQERLLFRL